MFSFQLLGKKTANTYTPDWLRVVLPNMIKRVAGAKVYVPIEFFMTVMAMEMLASEYGKHTLRERFSELNTKGADIR